MSFIVEDGSVVSGATSYVSLADADAYFLLMGSPTKWTSATNPEKQAALIYATSYLDNKFTWYSSIYSTDQELGWPRLEYLDPEGRTLGGAIVPTVIKDATCEVALQHLKSGLNTSSKEGILSEKLGDASVTYSSSYSTKSFSFVVQGLRNYGIANKSVINRVYRG